MGPEFWKLDKPTKLKKCSEKKSSPCSTETGGCCAVIPCEYCLEFIVAGKATRYGLATESGGHWYGTIAGASFHAYWEQYRFPYCTFVVELNGEEIFVSGCSGSVSCRDASSQATVTIYPDTGELKWIKREHRPLAHAKEEDSDCKTFFCGTCDCTCSALCVRVLRPAYFEPPIEFDPYLCEGMLPICGMCPAVPTDFDVHGELPDTQTDQCFGPDWRGTVDGIVFWITLRRGPYGECILSGTADGEQIPEKIITDCKSISHSWTMADGTFITIACKVCDCEKDPPPDVSDCCDSVPCKYCVTLACYGEDPITVESDYLGGGWAGVIGGYAFLMYWTRNSYGECIFVVEFNGSIIYSKTLEEGQSCEDNSDSVGVVFNYNNCTLTWQKYTPRPMKQYRDPVTYEQSSFCGTSDCVCPVLIAILEVADPYCCNVTGSLIAGGDPCDAPNWIGTLICNGIPYLISIQLSRDSYGACVLGGTINGEQLTGGASGNSASSVGGLGGVSFFMDDGSVLQVSCQICRDIATEEKCVTGCCWPVVYNYLYPCGYRIPVPFEIVSACDLNGRTGEFNPAALSDRGTCGSCTAAPPVSIGQTMGTIKVPLPGTSYCNDTPCSIDITLVLDCDEETVYGLPTCCGGFRLWVGTTERFVGWTGAGPFGGSTALYWIKVLPSSCTCVPLTSMIFNVVLELDCAEFHLGPSCENLPKDCCIPICNPLAFTVAI